MFFLQEVIQELLQRSLYIQLQMTWIAELTSDLNCEMQCSLLAQESSILRPVRNQPLIAYQ